MPQPTVGIANPAGTSAVPATAAGFAQPTAGNNLTGMAYKVNAGPLNAIGNFPPGGGGWSFALRVMDCPVIGATYLLTVFAGDSSGNFNTASVSFVRVS
jgi:hypothetical protein